MKSISAMLLLSIRRLLMEAAKRKNSEDRTKSEFSRPEKRSDGTDRKSDSRKLPFGRLFAVKDETVQINRLEIRLD